jgi:hypothetical protein
VKTRGLLYEYRGTLLIGIALFRRSCQELKWLHSTDPNLKPVDGPVNVLCSIESNRFFHKWFEHSGTGKFCSTWLNEKVRYYWVLGDKNLLAWGLSQDIPANEKEAVKRIIANEIAKSTGHVATYLNAPPIRFDYSNADLKAAS